MCHAIKALMKMALREIWKTEMAATKITSRKEIIMRKRMTEIAQRYRAISSKLFLTFISHVANPAS